MLAGSTVEQESRWAHLVEQPSCLCMRFCFSATEQDSQVNRPSTDSQPSSALPTQMPFPARSLSAMGRCDGARAAGRRQVAARAQARPVCVWTRGGGSARVFVCMNFACVLVHACVGGGSQC
jgi:hypothetical protein